MHLDKLVELLMNYVCANLSDHAVGLGVTGIFQVMGPQIYTYLCIFTLFLPACLGHAALSCRISGIWLRPVLVLAGLDSKSPNCPSTSVLLPWPHAHAISCVLLPLLILSIVAWWIGGDGFDLHLGHTLNQCWFGLVGLVQVHKFA